MTHTFVSDRVRLFTIGLFVALLFGPGFVLSLVDRFTNPHPADVQSLLVGLAVVFGLGLLWSAWLALPPIVVVDSTLIERRSFHHRRISLEPVKRLERNKVTRHRARFDTLTLIAADDRVHATLDLMRVRDGDAVVELLRRLTGAPVVRAPNA